MWRLKLMLQLCANPRGGRVFKNAENVVKCALGVHFVGPHK